MNIVELVDFFKTLEIPEGDKKSVHRICFFSEFFANSCHKKGEEIPTTTVAMGTFLKEGKEVTKQVFQHYIPGAILYDLKSKVSHLPKDKAKQFWGIMSRCSLDKVLEGLLETRLYHRADTSSRMLELLNYIVAMHYFLEVVQLGVKPESEDRLVLAKKFL